MDLFGSGRYLESFVTSLVTHALLFGSLFVGARLSRPVGSAGVTRGRIEWMTVRDLRLLTIAALLSATCLAQTNTVPGEFLVDPPTLVSLGFEWKISGDDNRNARVDVTYRKKGEQQWRKGLPLLRACSTSRYSAELPRERRPATTTATSRPICLPAAF